MSIDIDVGGDAVELFWMVVGEVMWK